MKGNSYFAVFLFLLALSACEQVTDKQDPDLLMGSWINPQYNEGIFSFERSTGLVEQEYGISFLADFLLIERKNAGWCGTPPIYYADFTGSWSRQDSIIEISVGFWGGLAEYRWIIRSLDDTHLEIFQEEAKYYHDEYLFGISPYRYYEAEIFDEMNLPFYGTWQLFAVSGGIHGGGHELNFDYLEIKRYGIYGFIGNSSILEYGQILIDEQTDETLLIRFQPDTESDQFMHDSEKYVLFSGHDSLTLASPCCDRFNYHFERIN